MISSHLVYGPKMGYLYLMLISSKRPLCENIQASSSNLQKISPIKTSKSVLETFLNGLLKNDCVISYKEEDFKRKIKKIKSRNQNVVAEKRKKLNRKKHKLHKKNVSKQ